MLLQVENIQKYYGNQNTMTKALDNLSFGIEAGEFVGVMGASGSGKTTLLNCISTIDTVSAGKILLEGEEVTTLRDEDIAAFRRDKLGFIFQDSNLLDTLTMEENISLPLIIQGVTPSEVENRINRISGQLGINSILGKFPYEVSGGQKQRCAAARAIVTKPKLIVADEPTGALDSSSAKVLMELMEQINDSLQATILLVTHDAVAASYSEKILFLRDGKIFNELRKGEKSRLKFYHEILDVLSVMGGNR